MTSFLFLETCLHICFSIFTVFKTCCSAIVVQKCKGECSRTTETCLLLSCVEGQTCFKWILWTVWDCFLCDWDDKGTQQKQLNEAKWDDSVMCLTASAVSVFSLCSLFPGHLQNRAKTFLKISSLLILINYGVKSSLVSRSSGVTKRQAGNLGSVWELSCGSITHFHIVEISPPRTSFDSK